MNDRTVVLNNQNSKITEYLRFTLPPAPVDFVVISGAPFGLDDNARSHGTTRLQGKRTAASRTRISDPWAAEEAEEHEGGDGGSKALTATGVAGAGAGGAAKSMISRACGEAETEGGGGAAAAVSAVVGAGGGKGGDGFVVAPRVPGRNVKRPVREGGRARCEPVLWGCWRGGGGAIDDVCRSPSTPLTTHAARGETGCAYFTQLTSEQTPPYVCKTARRLDINTTTTIVVSFSHNLAQKQSDRTLLRLGGVCQPY